MGGPMALAGHVDLGERRQAALDLLTQYIRIVDDPRRIEEWPALFSDDAEYIVITRENHERNLPIAVSRLIELNPYRTDDVPGPGVVPVWVEFTESGDPLVDDNYGVYQSVPV